LLCTKHLFIIIHGAILCLFFPFDEYSTVSTYQFFCPNLQLCIQKEMEIFLQTIHLKWSKKEGTAQEPSEKTSHGLMHSSLQQLHSLRNKYKFSIICGNKYPNQLMLQDHNHFSAIMVHSVHDFHKHLLSKIHIYNYICNTTLTNC
jgi:hypothetical protein